jgi:hypothetical protein
MEIFIKKGGRYLLRKFIGNEVVIKNFEVVIFLLSLKCSVDDRTKEYPINTFIYQFQLLVT